MSQHVAAFDVDGTITSRDCVVPYMRQVTGTVKIGARLLSRPDRLVPVLVRRDRDQLKALASAAAFRGHRHDRLVEAAQNFAAEVHTSWLRADTVERLRDHQSSGHRVVLVSASYELYLQPLAELLGIHDVLATRLVVRDGIVTGDLDGPNCRGPEKVRRLHAWLDEEFGGRSNVTVTAYGDSAGDREMLADADDAHWVAA